MAKTVIAIKNEKEETLTTYRGFPPTMADSIVLNDTIYDVQHVEHNLDLNMIIVYVTEFDEDEADDDSIRCYEEDDDEGEAWKKGRVDDYDN